MEKKDYIAYQNILPGITPELPDTFVKLARVIENNVFELVFRGDTCRVIYIMSDAVESFLRFENAKLTGVYLPDWEGEQQFSLTVRDTDYVLAVRQGAGNAFTLRFDDLVLEQQLYNYANIGHFWIPKYEYLRQIEYQVTMLWDKVAYLGESSCSPLERKLACLAEFPPILCHPSVPIRYRIIRENMWQLSPAAVEVFGELVKEAGDISLQKALEKYAGNPTVKASKAFARKLQRTKHQKVIDILRHKLVQAAGAYPVRPYQMEKQAEFERLKECGRQRIKRLREQGISAELLWEMPFLWDLDDTKFTVYIMKWKRGPLNRKVKIESFP